MPIPNRQRPPDRLCESTALNAWQSATFYGGALWLDLNWAVPTLKRAVGLRTHFRASIAEDLLKPLFLVDVRMS